MIRYIRRYRVAISSASSDFNSIKKRSANKRRNSSTSSPFGEGNSSIVCFFWGKLTAKLEVDHLYL